MSENPDDVLKLVNVLLKKYRTNRKKYLNRGEFTTLILKRNPPTYPFVTELNSSSDSDSSGGKYLTIVTNKSKRKENKKGVDLINEFLQKQLHKKVISKDELANFIALYTLEIDSKPYLLNKRHSKNRGDLSDTRPLSVVRPTSSNLSNPFLGCEGANASYIPIRDRKRTCRAMDGCKFNNKLKRCEPLSQTSTQTSSLSSNSDINSTDSTDSILSYNVRPSSLTSSRSLPTRQGWKKYRQPKNISESRAFPQLGNPPPRPPPTKSWEYLDSGHTRPLSRPLSRPPTRPLSRPQTTPINRPAFSPRHLYQPPTHSALGDEDYDSGDRYTVEDDDYTLDDDTLDDDTLDDDYYNDDVDVGRSSR